MNNICYATGCTCRVVQAEAFCRDHWAKLPVAIRLLLREHYNPRGSRERKDTELFARIASDATELLADIEHGILQPPKRLRARFVVGIDPGAKTGVAVWDRERQCFAEIRTLDFWRVYDHVTHYYRPATAEVKIEASHLINAAYDKRRSRNDNDRMWGRKNRNVGMNQMQSKLLTERFESLGFRVNAVKPSKATRTKLTKETFERLTGFTGSTSEHSRDAGMLAFQS